MSNECIQLAIAVGTWFTGIAALIASCVSLWIATRKKSHKIDVKAYTGFYSDTFGYIRCSKSSPSRRSSHLEEILEIIVKNRGEIPFVIHSLEIRFKKLNKKITLNVFPHHNQQRDSFNKRIAPGENTIYFYSFSTLILTQELYELFLYAIHTKKKISIYAITGFENKNKVKMPIDFIDYVKNLNSSTIPN